MLMMYNSSRFEICRKKHTTRSSCSTMFLPFDLIIGQFTLYIVKRRRSQVDFSDRIRLTTTRIPRVIVRRRRRHVLRRCRSLNIIISDPADGGPRVFPSVVTNAHVLLYRLGTHTCLLHTTAHHPPYPPIHSTLPHIARHPLLLFGSTTTDRPTFRHNITKQDTCLVRTHRIV